MPRHFSASRQRPITASSRRSPHVGDTGELHPERRGEGNGLNRQESAFPGCDRTLALTASHREPRTRAHCRRVGDAGWRCSVRRPSARDPIDLLCERGGQDDKVSSRRPSAEAVDQLLERGRGGRLSNPRSSIGVRRCLRRRCAPRRRTVWHWLPHRLQRVAQRCGQRFSGRCAGRVSGSDAEVADAHCEVVLVEPLGYHDLRCPCHCSCGCGARATVVHDGGDALKQSLLVDFSYGQAVELVV